MAAVAVVFLGGAAYGPLPANDFVAWDDDKLILDDPAVSGALGLDTLRQAFSFREGVYWQPLSTLSLATTRALWGPSPMAFHLENLLWHLATSLLLLHVLLSATHQLGRATMVAILYAVHPLSVESVAWAVERRNVLSAFFAILGVAVYMRWARRPRPAAYWLLLLVASLSLLAKALSAPLPGLLLALDIWPLERIRRDTLKRLPQLVLEKLPLAALSVAAALLVGHSLQALPPGPERPLSLRAANAVSAITAQLGHVVVPSGLAPFYEYPVAIPWGAAIGSALLIGCLTFAAWRAWNRLPYALAGWSWFLLGLTPTLGFVQAGTWPAFADRHVYIAAIGVVWTFVWMSSDLAAWALRIERVRDQVLIALTGVAVTVLALASRNQVRVWRDSVTLFSRAVQESPNSRHIQYNLGTALVSAMPPREAEAIPHFMEAVRLDPNHHQSRTNLGMALARVGRMEEALPHLVAATLIAPSDARANAALGEILLRSGRNEEAVVALGRAVKIDRSDSASWANLAAALNRVGRFEDTVAYLEAGGAVARSRPEAVMALGIAYAATGRRDDAAHELATLRQLAPALAVALARFIGAP